MTTGIAWKVEVSQDILIDLAELTEWRCGYPDRLSRTQNGVAAAVVTFAHV